MRAVIATFYKEKNKAVARVREKNRLWKHNAFCVIKDARGYYVVPKRQLEG